MNINIRNYNPQDYNVQKFQEGGEMPVDQGAAPVEDPNAAPAAGGDPTAQILEAAAQAVQSQDCNLAMQVLQALLQMAGGGAPSTEQAPMDQQPVYRKGGRLSRWIKK